MLDVVHRAVEILLQLNDDPTHLFGRKYGRSAHRLMKDPTKRLREFRDHINQLFGTPQQPFVPLDGDQPWAFTPSQWRRTLAWHIAHQPFGVVAGARQYQHAKIAMFEGYANPRVLHRTGEKPQVTRSRRCRNSVPDLRVAAA